jgi:hypothetical protein
LTPENRTAWTDERLDERMTSIDRTFELIQQDTRAIREEMHALRSELTSEMRLLRAEFTSLQGRLIQIGFAMVGVLLATLCSLVIAVA